MFVQATPIVVTCFLVVEKISKSPAKGNTPLIQTGLALNLNLLIETSVILPQLLQFASLGVSGLVLTDHGMTDSATTALIASNNKNKELVLALLDDMT